MIDTLSEIFKLLVSLLIILPLIYLTIKYGGTKLQSIQNNSFIRILERVTLSKDNSLLVVKIGDKGFVLSSTGKTVDILMELSEKEIFKLEEQKKIHQYKDLNEFYKDIKEKFSLDFKTNFSNKINNKLKIKKED